MSRPRVLVFGGPSGSGKTTLIHRLLEGGGFRLAVSVTTRPPRRHEREGRDYHFVDRDRFDDMVRSGELLEWATVHGDGYGTPVSELEGRGPDDRNVILDIDVQGWRSVKKKAIDAISLFIAPPSLDVLEERLRSRGTESEERIRTRLENARSEMQAAGEYDHVVVNHDVDRALGRLREILGHGGEAAAEDRERPSIKERP